MAEQYYLYIEPTDLCVKDSDIFWYQNYSAKLERGPKNLNRLDANGVGVLVPKKWRNNVTYILNAQICASRIPTFFGSKTTPQNWNADPKI